MELFEAICDGNIEEVKKAVESGSDVNEASEENQVTPLMRAVEEKNMEIVVYLIEKGADIHAISSHNWSVLNHAVSENGNGKIIKFLAEKGVDMEVKTNKGDTALMFATSYECFENVQALLESGANVNTKNNYGVTPLIQAVEADHIEIAELLLEKGADPNAIDKKCKIPWKLAIKKKNPEMILLFAKYANKLSTERDRVLRKAIAISVESNQLEMTKFLLENGAEANERNEHGIPLIAIAINEENRETVNLLLKYGANPNQKIPKSSVTVFQYAINKENLSVLLAFVKHQNLFNEEEKERMKNLKLRANARLGRIRIA